MIHGFVTLEENAFTATGRKGRNGKQGFTAEGAESAEKSGNWKLPCIARVFVLLLSNAAVLRCISRNTRGSFRQFHSNASKMRRAGIPVRLRSGLQGTASKIAIFAAGAPFSSCSGA